MDEEHFVSHQTGFHFFCQPNIAGPDDQRLWKSQAALSQPDRREAWASSINIMAMLIYISKQFHTCPNLPSGFARQALLLSPCSKPVFGLPSAFQVLQLRHLESPILKLLTGLYLDACSDIDSLCH